MHLHMQKGLFMAQSEKIRRYSQELRRNMTREERHLWYDFLRFYPVRFYRQKIFGNYIVDFYCSKARLVLELDGSQHYEKEYLIKDQERSAFLESHGLKVLRIANLEVNKNFQGVCRYIDEEVQRRIK